MICEKHGEFDQIIIKICGSSFPMSCPDCFEADRLEDLRLQNIEDKKNINRIFKGRMKYSRMPKKYQGFEIADCMEIYPNETKTALGWLNNCEDGATLAILGPKGSGKTTLACVVLKRWLSSSLGMFVTMYEMSKRSHLDGTSEFIMVPLLVIDEAGRQMGTTAEKNRLFEIINGRYNDLKPTIFITNVKREKFEAIMGSAVYDRIQENHTEIHMIRESLRK